MPLQVKQVGQKTGLVETRNSSWDWGRKRNYITSGSKVWAPQGGYRAAVWLCREKPGKAEAQLELTLAKVVSDNKKGIFRYVNSKRKSKENIRPILDEDGQLAIKDEEKAEAFNSFCLSF